MTLIGASALKELNNRQIRVLQAIEVGMKHSEYVEVEQIARYAGYPVSETERLLQSCHKLDLIHRWTGHFVGYELTIHGYDALALNALYEKGMIHSLGREKGVGKESRVFYALDMEGTEVILKLHRVGYTSFQHVRKKRRYTSTKRHISELYASRLSAETEMKWLKVASEVDMDVPKVYSGNRHIIQMELIDGIELNKLKTLPNPFETMEKIIEYVKSAWNEGAFVHGDLSEHNILMRHSDAQPVIIDFPQAVPRDHKSANDLLERDIRNLLTYFKRKHGIQTDNQEVIEYIISG